MEHQERADELEREADDAEETSERLEREIDEARSDWEAGKSDTNVPGAADEEATGAQDAERQDEEG